MKKLEGYTKRISWRFEAAGELWEVTEVCVSTDYTVFVEFVELREDGMPKSGIVELIDGLWQIVDLDQIERHGNDKVVDALEAFFNDNGPPEWPEGWPR